MKLHVGYWILTLIAICAILMLIVSASALQDANSDDILEKGADVQKTEKYVPGEILVKFKPGLSDKEINNINVKHETSVLYTSPYAGFKTLKVPKTKTVEEMAEIYSKNPNIEYAVPNYLMYATMVPNDEFYRYQWNFKDGIDKYGNEIYGINVEPAWDISTGEGVVVAVIDTGVAYDALNPAKTAPDLLDTNFVAGYDFVNNDNNPYDDDGHGTHVTGTIAQSTNNQDGVAGVAYGCTIMPVKVLDASGSGTLAQLVDGIYYASDNGADVISMSLGFPPSVTAKKLTPLFPALDYAYSQDIVIVAAAGNDAVSKIGYPAAYDKCIAVGATRYDGTRAYYSNYGSALDIMAPGGDIRVDQNNDGYGDGILQNTFDSSTGLFGYYFYQGTSMATPHVAGVAALLMAKDTTIKPDGVREAIQSTAKDMSTPGWDSGYGWGIVDAYAALNYEPASVGTASDSVDVDYNKIKIVGTNTLVSAKANVTIVDTTTNKGVGGVTVTGKWSGATTELESGVTDSNGQVIFYSNDVKVSSGNDATFMFTVDTVSIPWDEIGASDSITYTK